MEQIMTWAIQIAKGTSVRKWEKIRFEVQNNQFP